MMKKDTNTMINLDVKSNLAKLLATENITIQHNNVKTASFDVKNRVLTLPIFKEKSGDVYDMLIAHECAHALWTPYEEWEGITDKELRSYVNVIEDTRIDKLIQAKYPGVVKNYQNGFDILEKQNFFGISGKDINKDFMIIDKINLRSKSLNRLPFMFAPKDNEWLAKVDNVKTFVSCKLFSHSAIHCFIFVTQCHAVCPVSYHQSTCLKIGGHSCKSKLNILVS